MKNSKVNLMLTQAAIERHLEDIEKVIGPNYTLALVCKAKPECGDADILMTMLSRDDIMKVIDRHMPVRPLANTDSATRR